MVKSLAPVVFCSWNDMLEQLLRARRNDLAETTRHNYQVFGGRFVAWLDGQGVDPAGLDSEAQAEVAREFVNGQVGHLAWRSRKVYGAIVHMFFGFCAGGRHGEGLRRFKVIPERPAWKVSTIVKEKKDKALCPKADQWKALVDKLFSEGNLRDLALVLIAGSAGLRREELCNLLWQDLTFAPDGSRVDIFVRQGKGDRDRQTMGSAEAAEALLVFRESLTSDPWLSAIGSGKDAAPVFAAVCSDRRTGGFRLRAIHPDSVSTMFGRLSAELGWRLTCHSLRHFAAHTWIELGASVVDAKNLLGHSSIVVTQRYIDEEASSSLEKLSGIWKARGKSTVPQVPPRRMAIKPVGRLAA